jgi:hypothetical protein
MPLTESEALFERFCIANGIPFERIGEGASVTGDYWIRPNGVEVVCEVKQVEPNADERKAMEAFERGEVAVAVGVVGKRVRKKIKAASQQIRAYAKGRCPGVLVLWEPVGVARHLDAYSVKAAMFGFDTLVLDVPVDPAEGTILKDRKSGPGRVMTEDHSTSISAIAVLSETEDAIQCSVYHNHHAALPLPPESLRYEHVVHFRLREPRPGQFDEWQVVACA